MQLAATFCLKLLVNRARLAKALQYRPPYYRRHALKTAIPNYQGIVNSLLEFSGMITRRPNDD
jgi:hypothetical protein